MQLRETVGATIQTVAYRGAGVRLDAGDDGWSRKIPPQNVLGKIYLHAGKPVGSWHDASVEHLCTRGLDDHSGKFKVSLPKIFQMLDAPAVERAIIRKRQPRALAQPVREGRHTCLPDRRLRGAP